MIIMKEEFDKFHYVFYCKPVLEMFMIILEYVG